MQEPFCENPKCQAHKMVDSQSFYHKIQMYEELAVKVGKMPSPLKMKVETKILERVPVVRYVEGLEIRGWFCEVCAEAIKIVEGW